MKSVEEEESEEKKEGGDLEASKGEESAGRSFWDACITASTMSFAWMVFYSVRWLIASTSIGNDEMLLALTIALVASLSAMGMIVPLDWLADQSWTDDSADKAIFAIIRGLAILIGFAWEQCFDQAVTSLSSGFGHAAGIAKLFMALFVVSIIMPAWRWYILPFMVSQGWKTGFIIEDHNFANINGHLADTLQEATTKEMKPEEEVATKKLMDACKKRLGQVTDPGYQGLPGDEVESLRNQIAVLRSVLSKHVEGSLQHSNVMMDKLQRMHEKVAN